MAGSKVQRWLEFEYRPAGGSIRFPVGTVRGVRAGPTLAVVAGVHGSEYAGIEAAVRLYQDLDPAELSGTLEIAMIYNLPAFVGHTAFVVPIDGKDPGHCFPGTLGGTYSDAMAYHFTQAVAGRADFLVELHGGDIPEALAPYVVVPVTGNAEVDARCRAMAQAYNIPIISRRKVLDPDHPHRHSAYATAALGGAPAILAEAGQQGILDLTQAEIHVTGLRNVLILLNMLPGQLVKTVEPRFCDEIWAAHSPIDGMWCARVAAGQIVRAGQVVGRFRNYFGEDLGELRAGVDGVVTVLRTSANVSAGDTVIGIMTPEPQPGAADQGGSK